MELPLQITFRHVKRSDAIEAEIAKRAARLETYYDRIVGCHVLVDLAHRHHEQGNRYHVRITLSVPGEDIVVGHDPTVHGSLQDLDADEQRKMDEIEPDHRLLRVAIRKAFDVARRRLQDYARRQRGAVKHHERPPRSATVL